MNKPKWTFLELKIPPPIVLFIFALAMYFIAFMTPYWVVYVPKRLFIAFVFITIGLVLIFLSGVSFIKKQTSVSPRSPDSTKALVTTGLYRLSRNPMYVGFFFILIGFSVFLAHPVALFFLPAFILYMNRFQILPEERTLQNIFGQEYSDYVQRVRRWL